MCCKGCGRKLLTWRESAWRECAVCLLVADMPPGYRLNLHAQLALSRLVRLRTRSANRAEQRMLAEIEARGKVGTK